MKNQTIKQLLIDFKYKTLKTIVPLKIDKTSKINNNTKIMSKSTQAKIT